MHKLMEYENFVFKSIKYKNGPERDPFVSLKYRAESMDDGTPKEAKDKFEDLPHKPFREIWSKLLQFWKLNMEEVLGEIKWDHENIRLQQVKINWENEEPIAVKYIAKVATGFNETEKIPTPYISPGMEEGEIDLINDLCSKAEEFLHGARDQGNLFDEGSPNEDDTEPQKDVMEESEERSTDLSEIF